MELLLTALIIYVAYTLWNKKSEHTSRNTADEEWQKVENTAIGLLAEKTANGILVASEQSNSPNDFILTQILTTQLAVFVGVLRTQYKMGYASGSFAEKYCNALEKGDDGYIQDVHDHIVACLNSDKSRSNFIKVLMDFLSRPEPIFERRRAYNWVLPDENIQDDPDQGVYQMKIFSYQSYDDWKRVYRRSAASANSALNIQDKGGNEWSLLDLMDDMPCRKAYEAHLDPEPLGAKFGEQFNINDVEFEDGMKTGEFIKNLAVDEKE